MRWTHHDIVTLEFKGKTYKYRLSNSHWSHMCTDNPSNDKIFTDLGLEKIAYCAKHYGYTPKQGFWPAANDCDYEALNRVMEAIIKEPGVTLQGEPKKAALYSTVRERLDYFHELRYGAEKAFRELFGFEMPEDEKRLWVNEQYRLFHKTNFAQRFYRKDHHSYGKVDYIIYGGFEHLESIVKERICKCQLVFTLEYSVVEADKYSGGIDPPEEPKVYKQEEPEEKLVYPYRIKTWEEIKATPGVRINGMSALVPPCSTAFVESMHRYCGDKLLTNSPQHHNGWHVTSWMITENTPILTGQGGSSEAEMKMAMVDTAYTYNRPEKLKIKSNKPKTTIDTTVEEVVSVKVGLRKPSKSNLLS